jgi:hypothetical protein
LNFTGKKSSSNLEKNPAKYFKLENWKHLVQIDKGIGFIDASDEINGHTHQEDNFDLTLMANNYMYPGVQTALKISLFSFLYLQNRGGVKAPW